VRLVLDASVAVAAARPSEPFHAISRARVARVLAGDDEIVVPAIFPIEVGASLARVGEPTAAVCAPSTVSLYGDP
jgi:predicted nucleic acid-binding protein